MCHWKRRHTLSHMDEARLQFFFNVYEELITLTSSQNTFRSDSQQEYQMATLGNVTAHLAVSNNTAVLQPHLCVKKTPRF